MVRLILLLVGVIALSGCVGAPPEGMTWDSYYAALYNLKQTYKKSDVVGCTALGSVSGSSYDSISEAKDIAADKAVRKGADLLYFRVVEVNPNWHNYVETSLANIYGASGTAYNCR